MMRRFLLASLLVAAGGFAFFQYGRAIWHPVYVKVSGGRSVDEVVASLQASGIHRIDTSDYKFLILVGLKESRVLEVWGSAPPFRPVLLRSYPFTAFSGTIGPKLREGDRQIPEGLYRIESLNPNSSYHLSIKVDYPNTSDRNRAAAEGRTNLGGDIFIHGKAATIGCIPIGDPAVEELFLAVAEIGIENVEVILTPTRRPTAITERNVPWQGELYREIEKRLDEVFAE